jgi:hypothetical protein
MFRTSLRLLVAGSTALALLIVSAPLAAAQDGGAVVVQDVHRLGGSTAFFRPSLTSAGSLKRMSDDPRTVANIRNVLEQAGLASVADKVVAAFAGAGTSFTGGVCADATPEIGVIVECEVRPGQTMQWMAHRPRGTAPALLHNIRWAGAQPFRAYLFRVTEGDRTYTFVVPKVCGNVSLLHMEERPRAAAVVVPAFVPPPPPPPPVAVPVPVETPAPAAVSEPVSELTASQAPPAAPKRSVLFFVDGLFGKDRRMRPVDGEIEAAQCSPLIGLKLGVAKRFDNDWELATALGIAISMVSDDDKVQENEVFVDVVANKYVGRNVFVGGGLSLWDITHSDTVTPAALVHIGLPLAPGLKFPVYFLVEGRVFFDGIDDIANNYQFWGGVRIRF